MEGEIHKVVALDEDFCEECWIYMIEGGNIVKKKRE